MDNYQKQLSTWQKSANKQADFLFVKKLIKEWPQAEIYLVGGAVRDIILERVTKDFDFVVAKVEAKDLEKFLAYEGEVNLVGKSFGVFKFVQYKSRCFKSYPHFYFAYFIFKLYNTHKVFL